MRFKNKLVPAGLLLPVLLLLNGCNAYWEDHYSTITETGEKEKMISEMEKIPEISLFTEAVKNLDSLSDLLAQNRLYTVFAPVNESFGNIDPSVLNNPALLNRMLLYHFIDGKYKIKDFTSGNQLTFSNKYLNVSFDNSSGKVLLDRHASITDPDYLALNGMIQVVDHPLIPLNNLYEYFIYNPRVNVFARSIQGYTIKEFNREASIPVAINDEGQVEYDSVFNVTNPFLYAETDWIWEQFYNTNFRYIDISDEDLEYTFLAPTNFEAAATAVLQNPVLNHPIAMKDLAGPLLTNLVLTSRFTKDGAIAEIERIQALPDEDATAIQLYFTELLRNHYAGSVTLSNGIVHEVDGFEYDLKWLISDQCHIPPGMSERNYRDRILDNLTASEGVDTVIVSSNNLQIIFLSGTDFNAYPSKYGEWVNIDLEGDFYPVDYQVLMRGRNNSSGTFRVEIEGQQISEYDFSQAPSGDLDTEFDLIGTVSFTETRSSTSLKFTFVETHPEFNTNQQYLWIREIKLSPVLE
ncbi:MAG: fasciclin domain-containing protein [Bacteroidales bacterium]|nr:fasciclin domain-containing protein [Bacteroidales bacterium]